MSLSELLNLKYWRCVRILAMTEKETIPVACFSTFSMGERFSVVREISDSIEVGEGFLPEKIFLAIESKEEGKEIYDVAVNLCEDMFKEGEFVETLTQISQDPANYTPEINQRLRMTRIGEVILRDANRLLSESHLNPESFYKFAKILGAFNDNFGSNIAEPSVNDVLIVMRENQEENTSRQFVPCSPKSFEGYLKIENDLIVSYLSKGSLSMEMLHDLRRTSRRFLNLFLLKTLNYPDMESFRVYTYLRKVNTVLGECLDECKKNKEAGESEDLIKVPELAAELMTKFLTRIVWSKD